MPSGSLRAPASDSAQPPGAGATGNATARRIFAGLPPRYDLLAELLSFGQNRRWRRELVERVSAGRPATVLDVATGTAGVALAIHARSSSRVLGVDIHEGMALQGRNNVRRSGVDAISLALARAEELPLPDASVDALSFTYLLRYVDDPEAVLRELVRVVRPGGTIANLEFFVPSNPLWFACWWAYTRGVLPVAGLLAGGRAWYDVGRFLGPNISQHYRRYPLGWTVGAWERAGISGVTVRRMSLGGGVVVWGRRV